MSVNQPLFPSYGAGVVVAPNDPAGSVTLAGSNKQLVLTVPSSGTANVYVRVTRNDETVAASNADYLILPGMQVVISKDELHNRVSYWASGPGSSLHIIPCEGY